MTELRRSVDLSEPSNPYYKDNPVRYSIGYATAGCMLKKLVCGNETPGKHGLSELIETAEQTWIETVTSC